MIDHNFELVHMCVGYECCTPTCPIYNNFKFDKYTTPNGWKEGRRIVEFDVLLSNLKTCQKCRLGHVQLTYYNVIGETQKGLRG